MDSDNRVTRSPFSLKGIAIGSALSLAIGLIAPYGLMLQYFLIGFNPSAPGAIFLFFLLTLFVNSLLHLVRRRFSLSRADLVLIYCMLLMAVTVPTWGLLSFLIGTMVFPYYFASPENRFADLFHHLIPEWIVPQNYQAIKDFYEGLPQGGSVPWEVWLEPLGWWLALFLTFSLMMICTSTILHRQWSVHERLTYPMVQLPQQMIESGANPLKGYVSFFKNRVMWIGLAVPVLPGYVSDGSGR
ncbi:MAG: DUF6785 family protein [Gammaproteobacteria bacterium]